MSPDGGMLVSTDSDGSLIFWDLRDMIRQLVLAQDRTDDDPFPAIAAACFSPDGKWLLTTTGHEVQLREVSSGRTVRRWPVEITEPLRNWHLNEPISAVDFHPAGRMFACGGGARDVRGVAFLVDAVGRTDPVLLGEQPNEVWHVRFCRNGGRLASGGLGDGISLWTVAARKRERVLEQKGPIWDLAWAPEGDRLAVAGKDDIRIWNLPPGEEPHSRVIQPAALGIPDPERMQILGPLIAFPGDHSRLVVTGLQFRYEPATNRGGSAFVRILDIDHNVSRDLVHDERWSKSEIGPASLAVSADGKMIAVAFSEDIFVWRMKDTPPSRSVRSFPRCRRAVRVRGI
jgi:WD40 repeat protein